MIRARFYVGSKPTTVDAIDPLMGVERTLSVLALLHVQGATVVPAIGWWEGTTEGSHVVELLGDYTEESVRQLAESLRDAHNQDAVLWTMEPVTQSGLEARPNGANKCTT